MALLGLAPLGHVIDLLAGHGGAPRREEMIRPYFFVECKRCQSRVPVPEA
jgi:hypothetical protein